MNNLMTDWTAVPGFPGYDVNSAGDVRKATTGLRLRGSEARGYRSFYLRSEGRRFRVSGHRLVASAFICSGPIPGHLVVHHIDHDPSNNRLENLQLMTCQAHSEHHNQKHAKVFDCESCGAEFTPHPTKRARQKTCSWECRNDLLTRKARRRAGFVVIDGADHKPCSGCDRTLPFDAVHFHKANGTRYGLMSMCKECNRARSRDHARKLRRADDVRPTPAVRR